MSVDHLVDRAISLLQPWLPTAAEPGGPTQDLIAAHRLFESVARPLRRLEADDALEAFITSPYNDTDVRYLLIRSLTENPEFVPELMAAADGAPAEPVESPPLFDEDEWVPGSKFEIALLGMLMPGEGVARTCRIAIGAREGLIALTASTSSSYPRGLLASPLPAPWRRSGSSTSRM